MSLDLAYSVSWVLLKSNARPRTISRSGDKGEDFVRVSVIQFKLSPAVFPALLTKLGEERTAKMLCTLVTASSKLFTKLW